MQQRRGAPFSLQRQRKSSIRRGWLVAVLLVVLWLCLIFFAVNRAAHARDSSRIPSLRDNGRDSRNLSTAACLRTAVGDHVMRMYDTAIKSVALDLCFSSTTMMSSQKTWESLRLEWKHHWSRGTSQQPYVEELSGTSAAGKVCGVHVSPMDVVYTFVNGTAPTMRQVWQGDVEENQRGDASSLDLHRLRRVEELRTTIERLRTISKKNSSLRYNDEGLRLRRLISQLEATVEEILFPVNRFQEWGEIDVSLQRLLRCMREDPHGGGGSGICTIPLVFSQRIFIVVSNEDHIPQFLLNPFSFQRLETSDDVGGEQTKKQWRFVHKQSLVEIHIVTHSELLKSEANNNEGPHRNNLFNSNAIETLLHRIPGLSTSFVYFNNDMMWGRCPVLCDYFQPARLESFNMTQQRLEFTALTFGEDTDTSHVDVNVMDRLAHQRCSGGGGGSSGVADSRRPSSSVNTTQNDIQAVDTDATLLDSFLITQYVYRSCLLGRDHACAIEGRVGFAHTPRLFHLSLLHWLMDQSALHSAADLTRGQWHHRNDSSDVWVPWQYDHLMILLTSMWKLRREAMDKSSSGHELAVCRMQHNNGKDTTQQRTNTNDMCDVVLIRGNDEYFFVMLNDVWRIEHARMELLSFSRRHRRSLQQQQYQAGKQRKDEGGEEHLLMFPLFITLNDNLGTHPVYADGAGGKTAQLGAHPASEDIVRHAMGQLLGILRPTQ